MRNDWKVVALAPDLSEHELRGSEMPADAEWWAVLIPPPDYEPASVTFPPMHCDDAADAVAVAAALLSHRTTFVGLVVGAPLVISRTVTFAALVKHADPADSRYTPESIRAALRKVTEAHEALVRADDARRTAFARAESAKVPAPLPTGPDLSDHLYQNKVAFPQHRRGDGAPAGTLASADTVHDLAAGEGGDSPQPPAVGGEGGGP